MCWLIIFQTEKNTTAYFDGKLSSMMVNFSTNIKTFALHTDIFGFILTTLTAEQESDCSVFI